MVNDSYWLMLNQYGLVNQRDIPLSNANHSQLISINITHNGQTQELIDHVMLFMIWFTIMLDQLINAKHLFNGLTTYS